MVRRSLGYSGEYGRRHLLERGSTRVNQVEVSAARNFDKLNALAFNLFPADILAGKVDGHRVVFVAMNEPLPGRKDAEFPWVSFAIVFRNFLGFPAKEIHNGIVAEMQCECSLQIDDTGERYHARHRRFVSGETQSQLPSRGMPHHDQTIYSQLKSRRFLADVTVGGTNVGERARPTAALVPDSPIFDVERRDTSVPECTTKMPCMGQVVLGPPEAAVQIHQDRVRAFAGRQVDLYKLLAISPV